jgi:hypothetical protein
MWIRNTSQYPLDEVKRLVRFVAGQFDRETTARLCVNVRNSRSAYAGRAYFSVPHVSNAPGTARSLVVLRIGKRESVGVSNMQETVRWVRLKPGEEPDWSVTRSVMRRIKGQEQRWLERRVLKYLPYGGSGSPAIVMCDWQERLIALAAHEFTHIDQYYRGRPTSEVEAERMALVVLERYRKAHEIREEGAEGETP